MRKNIIIISIVIILTLVGCGKTSEINIDKTSSIIENSLINMQDIEDSTLRDVYGLELDEMDEYIIKQNDEGDLYAIIKTTNKSKVKSNMKEYFDKIKQFNVAYSPERLQILEDRVEKEIGNCLIYIISEDALDIYNEIVNEL